MKKTFKRNRFSNLAKARQETVMELSKQRTMIIGKLLTKNTSWSGYSNYRTECNNDIERIDNLIIKIIGEKRVSLS
tara:strand:+ start:1046 stop:1273 length:228 start_codon:yes stop_codon:yes gene_type:complete